MSEQHTVENDATALSRRFMCSECGGTVLTKADTTAVRCPACGKGTLVGCPIPPGATS